MLFLVAAAWLVFVLWLRRRQEKKPLPAVWADRLALVSLGATVLFAYFFYLFPLAGFEHSFPIDDSYITLTAARNLAEHNVFAVNPDAPVAGITSPLHVLLVGLCGKLVGVEFADRALGLAAYLAAVLGTFVWVRQLEAGLAAAAVVAAMTALFGPLTFGALNGLETDLFAALVVWSFVAFEASRTRPRVTYLVGALVGLAILTRPEGYFLAAALFGVRGLELLRQKNWRGVLTLAGSVGITTALVAPYLAVNYAILGHVFPLTVSAKRYFFNAVCQPFRRDLLITLAAPLLLVGFFAVLAPFALWANTWWRRLYAPAFLTIFYLSYLTQFSGALSHYWGRYQHPLLPLYLAALVLGGWRLSDLLRARVGKSGTVLLIALLVFWLLGAGVSGGMQQKIYRGALTTASEGGYLMGVVHWLQQHSEPGEAVAAHDIGMVSYFSGRRIVDLVGLTDPAIARIHRDHPMCVSGRERSRRLYEFLKQERPRLVYFAPEWDRDFLGLRDIDGGRHLRHAFTLRKMLAIKGTEVQVHQYDLYWCDWDSDLTQPTPPAP
jgi:hypothetical protein